MTDPLRLFGANLRVAANMRYADEQEARRVAHETAWAALQARATAIGCKLQRCYLDPDCDGECGCGSGLRDRDDNPVGDLASSSAEEDIGMFTLLVEQLEANGGVRP